MGEDFTWVKNTHLVLTLPSNPAEAVMPSASVEIIQPVPSVPPVAPVIATPSPVTAPASAAPSPSAPAATPSNLKSYTSTTYNYSLTYPSSWFLQRLSEGYDAPLVKITGPKNSTGFTPTLYISPTSPFSSSGAICANSDCNKTGSTNLNIRGGNYIADIINAGDSSRYYLPLPGKMVRPQGFSESIPLNIFASYQTSDESKVISEIISSVTY